jgi:hypothetical protein
MTRIIINFTRPTHNLRERKCLDPYSNKKSETFVGLTTYLLNGRVNKMICLKINMSLKEKVRNNRTGPYETVPSRLHESRSFGTVHYSTLSMSFNIEDTGGSGVRSCSGRPEPGRILQSKKPYFCNFLKILYLFALYFT